MKMQAGPIAAPAPGTTDALAPPAEAAACPACGSRAMLAYCAHCGEKRSGEDDYSLRRFLAEALQAVTNVDGRIGRTFRALLFQPGQLSAEHYTGVRRPYLGPLQLFLVCNVLFFALHSFLPINIFSTTLGSHLFAHPYGPLLLDLPATDGHSFRTLAEDEEAFVSFAHEFQRTTNAQAKTLVIILAPLLALLSFALYGRRRRFYAQHLVFSLHFYAMVMLFTSALGLADHLLGVIGGGIDDDLSLLLVIGVFGVYLAAATRRAFHSQWIGVVVKVPVLVFGVLALLYLYRFVLFFTTLAML
jgi:hypothetical protein